MITLLALLLSPVSFANALPANEILEKAEAALVSRCGAKYLDADKVALYTYTVDKEAVDQGINDYLYTLTYRFERDSLPNKFVHVLIRAYDVSNPAIDQYEVVAVNSNGYCK